MCENIIMINVLNLISVNTLPKLTLETSYVATVMCRGIAIPAVIIVARTSVKLTYLVNIQTQQRGIIFASRLITSMI